MKQDERFIKQRIEKNYNDANLMDLDKNIQKGTQQQVLYRMVNVGPAPCKVKVSEKSQEICAKIILK